MVARSAVDGWGDSLARHIGVIAPEGGARIYWLQRTIQGALFT